ncbi:small ribosomal subunit biogenesis GTPase RsgA [Teredinibacter franksiae]|uniref:small ribosomal subunit biogenesis GTPase RsgA n=1 Tax=Teredinibacter franksiae TaxID=2761453 RepID=UPI00162450E2|nr:small ribosomal subunit biogenesis GTPase RsgA [Teredinibacter franksiae]
MSKRKLTRQQSNRIANHQQSLRQKASASSDAGETETGLVLTRFGKQVDIEAENGKVWRCHLRANLGDVVTGDRVAWQQQDETCGVVVSVEPAHNRLLRPDSYGKMRAVAANIDQVLVTIAPAPEPHAGLIDRYLVAAENLEVDIILVVNKSDLLDPEIRCNIQRLLEEYRGLNYSVVEISVKTGAGFDQLREMLRDKISIFAGQSGVGKSSIIQLLLPDEPIKIGRLSEQVEKGRHTTTHSRLYHFPDGGNCIDSPGIREFGLWHMDEHDVLRGFIELRDLAGHCKFRDCQHQTEPGCVIRAAAENGDISKERFASFRRIIGSLDEVDVKTTLRSP